MDTYYSSDIPATIDLQNKLKTIQEEYKNALKNREHPEKELIHNFHIGYMSFEEKCQTIYENKVRNLCWNIIGEHKNSEYSHINLIDYPRFKELVYNAIFKTVEFLDTP